MSSTFSVLRVLGQVKATGADDLLYEIPADWMAVVSSIVACDVSGSGATIRICVGNCTGVTADTTAIYWDFPVAANETKTITLGITLGHNNGVADQIVVLGTTDRVVFTVFGNEVPNEVRS